MKAQRSSPKSRDPEEMIRGGLQLMKDAYYHEVGEFAQGLIDDSEKDISRDDFDQRLYESIDGHQWIMYTAKAQIVALVSDNEAAGFEEGIIDPSGWKDGIKWEEIAFWAMRRDVEQALTDRGVDFGADEPLAHAKRSRRRR